MAAAKAHREPSHVDATAAKRPNQSFVVRMRVSMFSEPAVMRIRMRERSKATGSKAGRALGERIERVQKK